MKTNDHVILVDENDQEIGVMDKVEAHRGDAKRHRAISVYLFRKTAKQVNGKMGIELLIQQRSEQKIVGANQWANTVCGNVRPGETYEECAYRRLKDELGIKKAEIGPIYKFEYHVQCNAEFSEWEMDQVFVGWYDGEVKPNPDEAQDFRWINWEELQQKEKEAELLTENFKTKDVEIKNLQLTLSPWFVWMLGDEELKKKIELFII